MQQDINNVTITCFIHYSVIVLNVELLKCKNTNVIFPARQLFVGLQYCIPFTPFSTTPVLMYGGLICLAFCPSVPGPKLR